VKFTERGEVTLAVTRLSPAGPEDPTLRFEVRDTGIGIDEDRRERLFHAFTQADASTTRRFGGTGLGLTISKQLVELMGGRIGVDSRLGEGSTFWFELPLPLSEPRSVSPVLRSRRILVASASDGESAAILRQLRSWGSQARSAASARTLLEALDLARREHRPYEVCLVDASLEVRSPGLMTQLIESDPARPPRLVGFGTSMEFARCGPGKGCRLSAKLIKPVKPSALESVLASLFGAGGRKADKLEASDSKPLDLAGMKVLLVEDNPVNQKVMRRILSKHEIEPRLARDGLEALEALDEEAFDVVLMDVQMPRMDGFQATAEFRRREAAGRHTPIIALTANAMKGDRERCLEAGMDDYLSKPVKVEDLVDKLRSQAGSCLGEV